MKIRSFAFMYAVRELKMRKKTFIPVICIAAGVMILLTNLLIFAQSEHTTDLAYLKTNTHLIMPNLTLDEADALESFEYVDRIDRVSDGSQYICYVKLKDKYLEGFRIYAETGIRAMEELGVTAKSPYNNYNELHRKYHFDDIFIGCGLYNTRYLRLMKEDPVFNPEFLLLLLFSFLTYFASIWLVFHMKVRRSRDEFASIRAMGASMRDLRTINQIEAVGITVIMYIPILLVSLLTMKIVCVLSENLYPEFALNSLLTFDPPWYMLAVSFIIFVFASYIAVLIVTRHLKPIPSMN